MQINKIRTKINVNASADPALVRVLSLRPAASVRKKRLQGLERNEGKLAPK